MSDTSSVGSSASAVIYPIERKYQRRVSQLEARCQDQAAYICLLETRIKELEAREHQIQIGTTEKPSHPSPSLPFELWQAIFSMATEFHSFAPLNIGETEEARDEEWNQSLRMRKAIVRVCSTWWNAGQSLLYEHIVLKKIPQLAGIVKILEEYSKGGTIGNLTRTIKIDFAVLSNWRQFYGLHMARLLRCCPKITTFIDNALNDSDSYQSLFPVFAETLQDLGRSSLSHLEMCGDDLIPFHTLLSFRSSLTALSLRNTELPEDGRSVVFDFPNLRKLTVCLKPYSPIFGHGVQWIMPSLHSLTAIPFRAGQFLQIEPFLQAYGHKLKSLNLIPSDFPPHNCTFHLATVLTSCPNLQRIAFDARAARFSGMHTIISHPLIEIVLCGILPDEYYFPQGGVEKLFAPLTPSAFPYLERIWTVDENQHGLVDPIPIPRRMHRMWDKWILHWKERGVRFENQHSISLRLYRMTTITSRTPWGLKTLQEDTTDDDEEESVLTDDESIGPRVVSSHGSLTRMTDESDFAYRYASRHDVEVPSSDEVEWKDVEDEMAKESDIDEETALWIYTRMIEDRSSDPSGME